MTEPYETPGPSRAEIDSSQGPLLLEFGVDWCLHCQDAAPLVAEAMAKRPNVRHVKVEDGKGRPLGRSFGVKLWPTLVFLKDGSEVARLVRPESGESIREGLNKITTAS